MNYSWFVGDILPGNSEIPSEKISAYLATEYTVFDENPDFILRVGEPSAVMKSYFEAYGEGSALFITAFNPQGQEQSDIENKASHKSLGHELQDSSRLVLEGAGSDPTGSWPSEKSYLAFGMGLEISAQIGQRFQQDAVLWVGADAVPRLMLLR
jgi:hypothetical protein